MNEHDKSKAVSKEKLRLESLSSFVSTIKAKVDMFNI